MHPASGVDPDLWAARRAVATVFFVNGASYANLLARLPSLREHLEMSERALGLVLLSVALGSMVAFRLANPLIGRVGSRQVTAWAASAFVLLLVGPAAAPSVPWAAAGLFVVGVAMGLMDVAMNAQAVEVERRYRRSILSGFHGLCSLGALVGAATGAVAAHQGLSPAAHLGLVAALALWPMWWSRRALVDVDDERSPPRQGGAEAARRRPPALIFVLGMVAFCSSVGEGAMADWAAVYLRAELHTDLGTASLVFVGFSFTMMVGRLAGDRITARLGAARVVRLGGALAAGGLALGLFVNTLASMFVGVVAVGAGLAGVVPVVFRAGGRIPNLPRATALATLATLSYGGFLVGPPAIGLIGEHVGLRLGMCLVVALAALMSLLSGALARVPTGA